jgi:hypothetical protein
VRCTWVPGQVHPSTQYSYPMDISSPVLADRLDCIKSERALIFSTYNPVAVSRRGRPACFSAAKTRLPSTESEHDLGLKELSQAPPKQESVSDSHQCWESLLTRPIATAIHPLNYCLLQTTPALTCRFKLGKAIMSSFRTYRRGDKSDIVRYGNLRRSK